MENLWERFDDIASVDDVLETKSQFTPVEEGVYKVILEELTPAESQKGLPMLKGKFRIVENNRLVFYNQMLQNLNYPNMTAVNVAEAVSFISGILGEDIEFTGLGALAELVNSIPTGSEHWVQVSYGVKDYEKKFTQLKVVEQPEGVDFGVEGDDDIPF